MDFDDIARQLIDISRELESHSCHDSKEPMGSSPNDYNPSYFSHSGWDCLDSPTKYCMYTVDDDSCIFCYGPRERK